MPINKRERHTPQRCTILVSADDGLMTCILASSNRLCSIARRSLRACSGPLARAFAARAEDRRHADTATAPD
jgi:hypothetical protein